MVNIGYHSARLQGKINRNLYKSKIAKTVRRDIKTTQQVPLTVYALSCERDLPEQVASIRSFITLFASSFLYVS